jgi:hypothetical protein
MRSAGRAALAVAGALFAARFATPWWCARDAGPWFAGEAALQSSLADGVATWSEPGFGVDRFHSGSSTFDGEWWFGAYAMAAMGYGQIASEHPELREISLRRMDQALDHAMERHVRAFDAGHWGEDALDTLDGPNAHVAYLGYLLQPLALRRGLGPSRFDGVEQAVTDALVRRYEAEPSGLLETYPGERYPVDNAAAIGAIARHDRATGEDHSAVIHAWIARAKIAFLDPDSRLLFQSMLADGRPLDGPRGSGTLLAAYFLAPADLALSRALYEAGRDRLVGQTLGFGALYEYADHRATGGDIDSGPLVLGYSISATGFALSGARMHRDPVTFARLYATAHLFGVPVDGDAGRSFVSGGPLGNALLFAMLTAPVRTP